MNVLSLFDGYGSALVALKQLGLEVKNYYASEIDEDAIKVAMENHPEIIQLGDVKNWKSWDLPPIDLVLGGSPCQGFSSQGVHLNFDDPRSKLFFTFVDILNALKPKHFMLENVIMSRKAWTDIITSHVGVSPIVIDSALVSAQTRKRNYWCSFPVKQPKDAQKTLKSVLTTDVDWKPAGIRGRKINPETGKRDDKNPDIPYQQYIRPINKDKALCLTTAGKDSVISSLPEGLHLVKEYQQGKDWRYFTVEECERLQTLPVGYTKSVSPAKAKKLIGNAWTIEVIVHILSQMPKL